jgi:hypothetical protein
VVAPLGLRPPPAVWPSALSLIIWLAASQHLPDWAAPGWLVEPDGEEGLELDCAIARLTPAASNAAELSALSLPSFMMISSAPCALATSPTKFNGRAERSFRRNPAARKYDLESPQYRHACAAVAPPSSRGKSRELYRVHDRAANVRCWRRPPEILAEGRKPSAGGDRPELAAPSAAATDFRGLPSRWSYQLPACVCLALQHRQRKALIVQAMSQCAVPQIAS